MESRRSYTRLDRVLMRYTDAVVALSSRHAAYLESVEGIERERIVVIENGIDADRFERVDPAAVDRLRKELLIGTGDRVVVMVASLRPEKAHEALLEAARTLEAAGPGEAIKFLIVGEGPQRGTIEGLRSRLGLDRRVFLLGEREDIPEILGLADVLVLPSHAAVETLPLAVLEAMAAGVPVVASAVGSVPEIIDDGHTGRLIAPADAVGLSEAIRLIFDKHEETKQIISKAREKIRARYTVEGMVARYEALFERLAETRTRNHG
jgi:glycosyltransferase involved in cell wall biosynthesis